MITRGFAAVFRPSLFQSAGGGLGRDVSRLRRRGPSEDTSPGFQPSASLPIFPRTGERFRLPSSWAAFKPGHAESNSENGPAPGAAFFQPSLGFRALSMHYKILTRRHMNDSVGASDRSNP
jgi:hypothetical protein